MRIALVGYRKNYFESEIKKEKKLVLVENNPDVVIAFGGEGTFLFSEIAYPGVPKVFVVHSNKCKNCKSHDYKKIIRGLLDDEFKAVEFMKVQGSVNGKTLIGLNEINIHYIPPCAIRFDVDVDKKTIVRECVGDGLVVSTPYGSSGYFSSITRKTFDKGMGIAFNNPVNAMAEVIVLESSKIKVKIVRGPGVMCADCNRQVIPLKKGDVVRIQKHARPARIMQLYGEMKVRI